MNSDKSSVYSIKCTNCAAPLNIYGGGRVTTVTCQYCNSVIDLTDHYKVVAKFNDKDRPKVPFTLGMVGELKGVKWTIIGWVTYKTTDSPVERWSEFFLYSPLYGYGWLIYEYGKVSFSKRIRDFALREWQEKDNTRSAFYQKGHYVLAEEPYIVEIEFVQGELSWIAKVDDQIECWDYNGMKRKSISIEKSKDEVEVYLNEKLETKDVYDSFGVKESDREEFKEKKSAIDKVFDEGNMDDTEKSISVFVKGVSLLAGILVVAIIYSFFSAKLLVKESTSEPFEQMFTVDSSAYMSQINIKAASSKLLDNTELDIYKSNKLVFSIDKSGSYSNKTTRKTTWHSNRDDSVTIYTKLDEGLYRVSFKFIDPNAQKQKVSVSIKEKVMRLKYLLPLLILMLIALLPTIGKNMLSKDRQKFIWWGLGGLASVIFFGAASIIFVIVIYFIVSSNSTTNSSYIGSYNDSDDFDMMEDD